MKRACLLILVSLIMTGTVFAQSKQAASPYKSALAFIELVNDGKPLPDLTAAQVDDLRNTFNTVVQINPTSRPCAEKWIAMLETPGWYNNEVAKALSVRVSSDELDRVIAVMKISKAGGTEADMRAKGALVYSGLAEADMMRRMSMEIRNVLTSFKLSPLDAAQVTKNYPCGGSDIVRQPRSVGWTCTGAYQIIDATPDGDGQWTATYTSRTQPGGSFKINPANRNVRSCALTWVY